MASLRAAPTWACTLSSQRSAASTCGFRWLPKKGRAPISSRGPVVASAAPAKPVVKLSDFKKTALDRSERYKCVLSLDGGGMRGLISAKVLCSLERAIREVIIGEGLLQPDVHETITGSKQDNELSEDEIKEMSSKFNIDLADYFDLVTGTSTGGLLALYLASKGGKVDAQGNKRAYDNQAAGTAANAVALYKTEGERIFGGNPISKVFRALLKGGQFKHSSAGLEAVLDDLLGDMTLDDLDKSVAIPAINVNHGRTCVFFHYGGGRRLGANGAANAPNFSGFATPLRRGVLPHKLLVRPQPAKLPMPLQDTLQLEEMKLVPEKIFPPSVRDAMRAKGDEGKEGRKAGDFGAWFVPVQYNPLNFYLKDIARATSAAPVFLPPAEFSPVTVDATKLPQGWPATFMDGGLSANDPSWVGLLVMLQEHFKTKLCCTAILSIGTGQVISGRLEPKGRKFWEILNFLGDLVSLTMSLTSEDKEIILRVLYNGLLYLPEGQYLRVQLKQRPMDAASYAPAHRQAAKKIKNNPPTTAASTKDRHVDATSEMGFGLLTPEEYDALNRMDDPSQDTLQLLESIGDQISERFYKRMKSWVRYYIFCCESPVSIGEDPSSQPEPEPEPQPEPEAALAASLKKRVLAAAMRYMQASSR